VISSGKMRSCDRRRHITVRGRKGIYVLSALILLVCCGTSSAQDAGARKDNSMPGMIAKLEDMRSKTMADIRRYEGEILKCDNTIMRSENIVRLARQKGNAQAETIAREALAKAQEAKKKNQENLKFAQSYKELLEKKINGLKGLMAESSSQTEGGDDCKKLEAQLALDNRVLKDFKKTVDMTNKEREDWTKDGEDAMSEARESITKYLTSGFTDMLEKRLERIDRYRKVLDNLKTTAIKDLPNNKDLLNRINVKIEKTQTLYKNYKKMIIAKNAGKYAVPADDLRETMESEYGLYQKIVEEGDRNITEILKDQEVREKLSDIGSYFTDALIDHEIEIRKASAFFSKVSPCLSALPLVRDLSYTGMKLELSWERVSQLADIADQQLEAEKALRKQIERTRDKLKECRPQ